MQVTRIENKIKAKKKKIIKITIITKREIKIKNIKLVTCRYNVQ